VGRERRGVGAGSNPVARSTGIIGEVGESLPA
jgi:hypothetical protein